jgi:hypothetical protein
MTRMHCSKLLGVFGGGGGGIMLLRSVLRLAPFESGASLAFRAWLCGRIRVLGAMPFSTALISLKWEKVPSQSTVHAAIVQTLESVVAARRARIISSMVWIEKSNGAIHATMAKKILSRHVPFLLHGKDGVPAEKAMAATVWKQVIKHNRASSAMMELHL